MTVEISSLKSRLRFIQENNTALQIQLGEEREEKVTLQNLLSEAEQEKMSLNVASEVLRSNQTWRIRGDDIEISGIVLGNGAFGRVRRASYRGSSVAVKEIHGALQIDYIRLAFLREITFSVLCHHPNIVQFLGVVNQDSNNPLIVAELLDISLYDLLLHREDSERARNFVGSTVALVRVGGDLAAGLNYLHMFQPRPIIHRDVTSSNIMLLRQHDRWTAKLAGFGSMVFAGPSLTANAGNPFYAAPEARKSNRQTTKVKHVLLQDINPFTPKSEFD